MIYPQTDFGVAFGEVHAGAREQGEPVGEEGDRFPMSAPSSGIFSREMQILHGSTVVTSLFKMHCQLGRDLILSLAIRRLFALADPQVPTL